MNNQKRIDEIFANLLDNIGDNKDGFIEYMSKDTFQFSNRSVKQIKENYTNFIKNKRGSFQNAITTITQSIVNLQQSYVRTIGQANTVTYPYVSGRGTDGYQQSNGKVITYLISGTSDVSSSSVGATNTLTEFIDDIKKIKTDAMVTTKIPGILQFIPRFGTIEKIGEY